MQINANMALSLWTLPARRNQPRSQRDLCRMVGASLKSFADGAQVIILTSRSWADVQQPQASILMIYVMRFAEV